MTLRATRRGAFAFFLLFAGAVTWPGLLLGNRIEPRLFGLPFVMVWVAAWVLGGGLVLFLLDRAEERARQEPTASGGPAGGSSPSRNAPHREGG